MMGLNQKAQSVHGYLPNSQNQLQAQNKIN